MSEIINLLINTSIASSLLILFIFMLRFSLKGKINPRLQYALWIIVAVRLIIPFNSQWTLEINNIFPQVKTYDSELNNKTNEYKIGEIEYMDNSPSYSQANTEYKSPSILSNENYEGASDFQWEVNKWSMTNILFIAWIVVAITLFIILTIRNAYFYRITIKSMKSYNFPDNIYDESAKTVGLKKRIPVYLSHSLVSPCIIGVINPIIILTENIIQDPKATRFALIHEMVHYKQKDNIIRFFENILCAIYWFNPLVWLAAHSARNDAELACDSIVLKKIRPSEHYNYCLTLLSIASNSVQMVTALSAGGSKIKKRIGMILDQPKRIMTSIFVLVISIILGLGSFINVSLADNFISNELFIIKDSKDSAKKYISLGNIQEVYNILATLPSPNDYYKFNLVMINNEDGYNLTKNLDITYELCTWPALKKNNIEIMNRNALQLFSKIHDLEAITFTYIDKIANTGERIRKTPIAYSYKRSQIENKLGKSNIEPHVYKRLMESAGGNNMILVFGYSDLYEKLGIGQEEFKKNPKLSRKVFSSLGSYSDAWIGGNGSTVYKFSPNPVYSNWKDLVVHTDGYGNIVSHGIVLSR